MGTELYLPSYPGGKGITPAFRQHGWGSGAGPRSALWFSSAFSGNYAARADLARPHLYSSWTDDDYLYVAFWAHCYYTTSTDEHPFFSIYNPTYNSGFRHGPRYNNGKCRLYSSQRGGDPVGDHADYWDLNPTTVLGDAGDGTGNFVNMEWHHFMINHSWNGSIWVDGYRTQYSTNDGQATWSVHPTTSNGWQDLTLDIAGHRNLASNKPQTGHFGLTNLAFFDPDGMVTTEFDNVQAIDPADGWQDRFCAWLMNNPVDNSKSGLLWGYPMQDDLNDVGPHSKHLTKTDSAIHGPTNGTYEGPYF